ncbi:glutathionyl-hydroquinone reductase YqjG-like isoform X2 [Ruditapes philippinarum]|uniref:glutathionyl-hydroquinone reductase YqjG-like isoform X2 n=1 Tax=Ruditapes philippinarum TaxID=129788 RepID=UPI00295ACDFE|nr:glutathionyl-hydroquinone reductase YqjG-like isoform X2 [Ruditapes philippinarum]
MSSVIKHISKSGEFIRKDSIFRNWITSDGSSGFKAEAGRYHLYVSLACPWAHRTLIVRHLKGLEDVISVNVVDLLLTEKGWHFSDEHPNNTLDTVNGCKYLKDVYRKANPDYDGAITVPVLWDKQKNTLVNNESSEIIRMLNSEFNSFCQTDEQRKLDLYPENLRDEINELNSWIYPNINNGVYRCGFARSQQAYDDAVIKLFDHLDKVEIILSKQRYLTGNQFTEADVRLFTTLVRFDWVYHGHFKCNKKMLKEYPNIWAYAREIYQMKDIAGTVDKDHIRKHYHESHTSINPFRILPVGADLDFLQPHRRENIGK